MEIIVLAGQSWFDIALQYTGNVLNVVAIAVANNRSITSALAIGEKIIIPTGLVYQDKTLQYFKARNIIPATRYNY
jgi:hypothetical protein